MFRRAFLPPKMVSADTMMRYQHPDMPYMIKAESSPGLHRAEGCTHMAEPAHYPWFQKGLKCLEQRGCYVQMVHSTSGTEVCI